MATYDLAFNERRDGVAVVQTFVATDIQTADSVVIASAGNNLNGTHKVISTEPYYFIGLDEQGDLQFDSSIIIENQVLFFSAYDDLDRDAATGTISYTPVCTWITDQDVLDWLGVAPATANDLDFVSACTDAANALAYRRRKESGYTDSLSVVPGADIALGVRMYAGSLYRQRGSVDSFQSFEAYAAGSPAVASMGEILRLWGCNRPQVG